jgi:uncharacterized membrane protein YphA (DoxX/SURF4 family)
MKHLKTTARLFYGAGIAGIAVLHFLYSGFRPVILPFPQEATANLNVLVYLIGIFLLITGLLIAIGKWTKPSSLILAVVLLLFFVFGHLPNRLTNMITVIGAWTDALKLLALSGGALIVARVFTDGESSEFTNAISKISFLGKYFFGIMLVIFGIDHFVYTDFVKTIVPLWIPGNLFWTYVAGVALIGAGIAFIINFKIKIISILTGTMLFVWLIVLHIPRAVAMDTSKDPNEIVSVFECLAFSGIAFLLYFDKGTNRKPELQ